MRCTHVEVLSAVTISLVTAFGVVGCDADEPQSAPPLPSTTLETSRPTVPLAAPLPAPDVLAGVLLRLADTSIPAEQKVDLVQYATADDAAALTNFGEALKATGFDPLIVQATDLTWAGDPGHVTANVTLGTPDPRIKAFTFPMEFSPMRDTWQLSQRTADQLLPLVGTPPPPR